MAVDSKWVCLSANPTINIELIATDIPGVFKTEEINVTCKGEVLGSYDHVRVCESDQTLAVYDLTNRRDAAPLGHFIALN